MMAQRGERLIDEIHEHANRAIYDNISRRTRWRSIVKWTAVVVAFLLFQLLLAYVQVRWGVPAIRRGGS